MREREREGERGRESEGVRERGSEGAKSVISKMGMQQEKNYEIERHIPGLARLNQLRMLNICRWI